MGSADSIYLQEEWSSIPLCRFSKTQLRHRHGPLLSYMEGEINRLTCRYTRVSTLDANSRFRKIEVDKDNPDKAASVSLHRLFCFICTPFGQRIALDVPTQYGRHTCDK